MNTGNGDRKAIITTELIVEIIRSIAELILAIIIIKTDRQWLFPFLFVVIIERALREIAKSIKEAKDTDEE